MKSYSVVLFTVAILVFLTWIPVSLSCNKALCASDVSKCLIQELCQCRPGEGNCSCCKECMLCLGTLWDECCDCVDALLEKVDITTMSLSHPDLQNDQYDPLPLGENCHTSVLHSDDSRAVIAVCLTLISAIPKD
uniref:Twisted gastrulation BMP signaling modulator 1 n=1 Tax=Molossus molossus TaxID=27622 RepID=A0A7J8HMB1_MOLMO|nr:twisted gastrulation BMP signaling modulator 1 [Molossus molossus]